MNIILNYDAGSVNVGTRQTFKSAKTLVYSQMAFIVVK